jgi:hypothetical protein
MRPNIRLVRRALRVDDMCNNPDLHNSLSADRGERSIERRCPPNCLPSPIQKRIDSVLYGALIVNTSTESLLGTRRVSGA